MKLKQKLQRPSPVLVIFTARKIKTRLSILSTFDCHLKNHVVYEINSSGCSFFYVGQTCRRLTTWITENQKRDSPVGQHVAECGQSKAKDFIFFVKNYLIVFYDV